MRTTTAFGAILAACALTACGSDDDDASMGVPDGATLCGVYAEDYRPILNDPTPFGEDGWEEEAQALLAQAQVLERLAPTDQAENADANVAYFQALADIESATDHVAASNEFNAYLRTTCG